MTKTNRIASFLVSCLLVFAAPGCEDAGFQGANGARGKSDNAKGGGPNDDATQTVIPVGDTQKLDELPGHDPKKKIDKVRSRDPDIATVSDDGTITGKSPGTTTIVITYEDGSVLEVKVKVFDDEDQGRGGRRDPNDRDDRGGGRPGDDEDTSGGPGGELDTEEGEASARGCRIDGDKIKWDWPKEIQDCFDADKLWDFTRDKCTDMPQAKSFDCTWNGIDKVVKGIKSNFTPDWDEKRLKLISCGERESGAGLKKKKTVAWQYIMLPKEAKDGACNFSFGAGIAIGCYEEIGFNLQSSDPKDVQRCLDGLN